MKFVSRIEQVAVCSNFVNLVFSSTPKQYL
jgi:hypothetical protein